MNVQCSSTFKTKTDICLAAVYVYESNSVNMDKNSTTQLMTLSS